jgi:hypothetical protein
VLEGMDEARRARALDYCAMIFGEFNH